MADERAERDPGRELLQWAAEQGLITEATAADLDSWAGELATQLMRDELTQDQLDALIAERLERDLKRRGEA
jgi:hypothetical protein